MLYHQTPSDFCWQTSPFGSPRTKLLCQEHARQSPAQVPRAGHWEHPSPTLQPARPRERGEPGTPQKPPPGSFVGAPCARSGTAIGSRCARWQRRHWERDWEPLRPLTNSYSDIKSNRVGCTGAVTARSPLPAAAGTPERSLPLRLPPLTPAAPAWHRTVFRASHGAPAPSRKRDDPCGHKTGPNTSGERDPQSPKGHGTGTSRTDGQH